ncbi:hypothetical protein [uncultured Anaerovibrio sp.]|uniref:hypothetical protein n=1 Tax=uncultured Anaerovibrio sp. TaxID=361586 RepID=UPI0026381931|nr:hypothetical protein [uncultured Anaerovibrio sp.]
MPSVEKRCGWLRTEGTVTCTHLGDWFAPLDYAQPIGSHQLMSKDAESRGRIWFIAGKVF